jgi:signal peptidase II
MRDKRWLMLLIAAVVVVVDRLSKNWVAANIPLGRTRTIIPHTFWISHVMNTGAAFSLGDGHNVRWLLVGFSVVAVIVVIAMIWKLGRTVNPTAVALALILGGAIGNMYDRIKLQYVIDFLYVNIYRYHWPDFNVADSAIVVGACVLLFEMLRPQRQGLGNRD